MNCPKCGNVVAARRSRCEFCGKDLTIYRRTSRLSNAYYNRGLEKAKVRDLTGAVLMLKKSLEMNKRNTNARNLLGLVFFEMGETVAALSEWVISNHFQAQDNDADVYIGAVQANPTKIDAMNQAIKKYNLALEYTKQGSEDLAIIQLKKVISLNPHFLRALLLISLLYIKNNEPERAKRYLQRAEKIDLTNTMTLRYLKEVDIILQGGTQAQAPYWGDTDTNDEKTPGKSISPISSYKEEKPNAWLYINLVLGAIVGILVVYFLVVPTVKQSVSAKYIQNERDFNSELSVLNAKLTSSEKKVESLTQKLEEKQKELDGITIPEYDREMYDNLFIALYRYLDVKAKDELDDAAVVEIAGLLSKVDPQKMDKEEADKLYAMVKDEVYPLAAKITYKNGKQYFDDKKYDEAYQSFLSSYQYEPADDYTLYYLGKTCVELDLKDEAKQYYQMLLDQFPDSGLVKYTKQRLDSLNEQ